MLTRESILNGAIRAMLSDVSDLWDILSDEELTASRRAVLAAAEPGAEVWLFGYGSLIWNPAFHYVERRIGRAHGYHRRFCLWSHVGRGSRDKPGLVLGLDHGGSCCGVVYRLAGEAVESEFNVLWQREMVSGAYTPRWITVRTDHGPVRAVAFAINHDHPRYAGRLTTETHRRRHRLGHGAARAVCRVPPEDRRAPGETGHRRPLLAAAPRPRRGARERAAGGLTEHPRRDAPDSALSRYSAASLRHPSPGADPGADAARPDKPFVLRGPFPVGGDGGNVHLVFRPI